MGDYTPTVMVPTDQLKVCTTPQPHVGYKEHPHGKREEQSQRGHLYWVAQLDIGGVMISQKMSYIELLLGTLREVVFLRV